MEKYDEAIAFASAPVDKNNEIHARRHQLLGQAYAAKNKYDAAKNHFDTAKQYFEDHHDELSLAKIHSALGDLFVAEKIEIDSMHNYSIAVSKFKSDFQGAFIFLKQGDFFYKLGDNNPEKQTSNYYDRSLNYLAEAKTKLENIGFNDPTLNDRNKFKFRRNV